MTELALQQCQRALAAADALADLVEGDHHGDAHNRLVWADDRRIDELHVRRFLERDDPRLEARR